ncbi:DUF305 domain-containing protein [Pedobacter ginsengisoli]|uniref:DUF305 domain-containing protein n=1 Tax=Pedobacter ginsengisoli TaxID=363852 RepID=A0A2D1U9B9_9SPHI|nr:DUF305 domain-containing protein [Pedobacter ginsengisoli]ATP58218.1 DUF305 domain-containing protein [Pedobacter ginsengisoli]
MKQRPYSKFLVMLLISFFIMYGVMFLNISQTSHIYFSLNRLYMTIMMVSPMSLLMLKMMRHMYSNKSVNRLIIMVSSIVFILSFIGLRRQSAIGDRQYLKGMIPHHSSAIMTSERANLKDPETRELADSIIKSQQREITQMKAILRRMDK